MSSPQPQQSQSSRVAARRRQRGTRLVVAVSLLVVSALLVLGAVLSGESLLITVAAGAAVVLGAAATRITHSELADARVDAARDRATQARDYAELTERRTTENRGFAADMRRKIAAREEVITGLESALSTAQRQLARQTRQVALEARRADEAESNQAASDERASQAIVLVAELEAELHVLRAELTSWQDVAMSKRANSA